MATLHHRRMDAMQRRWFADRLVSLHRRQRRLDLEPRRVRLPFPWRVDPLSWTANSSLFDCPVFGAHFADETTLFVARGGYGKAVGA
jgi:hypothetical protein